MFDTLSTEELLFVKAIETFKVQTGKKFLSWTEVLQILKDLGYRKLPPSRLAELVAVTEETPSGVPPQS